MRKKGLKGGNRLRQVRAAWAQKYMALLQGHGSRNVVGWLWRES